MLKLVVTLMCIFYQLSYASPQPFSNSHELHLTQTRIEKMTKEDQAIRFKVLAAQKKYGFNYVLTHPQLFAQMYAIDKHNEKEILKILSRWGWPNKERFGKKSSDEFWLLVQHADYNLTLQKTILQKLQIIAQRDPTEASHFAYLWDRVQMHLKLPQRYGTQGFCKRPHCWQPFDIEDERHIDALRKAVGLGRFEDYRQIMNTFCL